MVRSSTTALIAMVVTLAAHTHADELGDRNKLIEGQYIVTAQGQACKTLKTDVEQLRIEIEGPVSASSAAVTEASMKEVCFVTFNGGGALKKEVEKLEGVIHVEQDAQLFPQSTNWGRDRIDQPSLPLDGAPFDRLYNGSGVDIYIFDTGIYVEHNDFGGRAVNEFDAAGDGFHDNRGHGTHVAGIAGGNIYGVANGANLKSIRIFDNYNFGSATMVIRACEYVYKNAPQTSVISVSLSVNSYFYAINAAYKTLVDSDHIVVIAAGNNNRPACHVSPAGLGGHGRIGGAVTVGAIDKNDAPLGTSNYGECVDIWAPGADIWSAFPGAPFGYNKFPDSGTSVAAPFVAGVAAVLLEKHGMNKSAALEELFSIAVEDQIVNAKPDSVNLVLQMPSGTRSPTTEDSPAPTGRPTISPTTAFQPTFRPTSAWSCPRWAKDKGNGCDCGCGGGDADCLRQAGWLWCWEDGVQLFTRNNYCDPVSDRCIEMDWSPQDWKELGFDESVEPGMFNRGPQISTENSSGSLFTEITVGVGMGLVVAAAVVFVVSKRASKRSLDDVQSLL